MQVHTHTRTDTYAHTLQVHAHTPTHTHITIQPQQRQVSPVDIVLTPSPTSLPSDDEILLRPTTTEEGDDSGIVSTSGDYEVGVSTTNPRNYEPALVIPSWNGVRMCVLVSWKIFAKLYFVCLSNVNALCFYTCNMMSSLINLTG